MTCHTVAAGRNHFLFIDAENIPWSCGLNDHGQLGSKRKPRLLSIPFQLNYLPPIRSVSAGRDFSLFLDFEGCVWACGSLDYGAVGIKQPASIRRINVAQKIPDLPKIVAISSQHINSFFLDEFGCVWACGSKDYGCLGLDTTLNRVCSPTKLDLERIKDISTGAFHCLFLDEDDVVWACGNWNGKGDNKALPEQLHDLPKIQKISSGIFHSLFLDFEGGVWACGSNNEGQLNLSEKCVESCVKLDLPRMESIFATGNRSAFIDESGLLWTCGAHHSSKKSKLLQIDFEEPIVSVSAGAEFVLYLDVMGSLFACGDNTYGQLGTGDCQRRRDKTKIENIPQVCLPELAKRRKCKSARNVVSE